MEVVNELAVRGLVVGVFAENCWIVGSPQTVIKKLQEGHALMGYNLFCGNHEIGKMPHDQVMNSIRLFGKEVVPAGLAAIEAAIRGTGISIEWTELPWGCDYYLAKGDEARATAAAQQYALQLNQQRYANAQQMGNVGSWGGTGMLSMANAGTNYTRNRIG